MSAVLSGTGANNRKRIIILIYGQIDAFQSRNSRPSLMPSGELSDVDHVAYAFGVALPGDGGVSDVGVGRAEDVPGDVPLHRA